jgi:hypothetical protein
MSGFTHRPFINLRKFMSSKIPRAIARKPTTVDTKAELEKARSKHYAAEDAKELKKKHDAVIGTQKKLATASTELQAAKVVEAQKKVAKDIVPNHHDKTQVIDEHNKAVGDHKDAKDKHDQAKKEHEKATTAVKQAGGRRRHTRHKRRKSKHRRHKRRTKKHRRKRHTKKRRRKRHTKKRRRSRRR